MDTVAVTALIISVLSALGHFLQEAHIRRIKLCFGIESDCYGVKQISRQNSVVKEVPSICTQGC